MTEKKRTVLIVDDEADFVRSTSYRLKFEGFETIEASSAEEALAILDRNVPDIILLDVMMPGMTGVEFYEQISNNKDLAKIPVIFLTVWDQIVPAGMRATRGRTMLITKPFDFSVLINAMKELLSS